MLPVVGISEFWVSGSRLSGIGCLWFFWSFPHDQKRWQLSSEIMIMFQARKRKKGMEIWAKRWGPTEPDHSLLGSFLDLSQPVTSTDILVARSVSLGKKIWEMFGEGLLLSLVVAFFFFPAWHLATPQQNCYSINKEERKNGSWVGNWQPIP